MRLLSQRQPLTATVVENPTAKQQSGLGVFNCANCGIETIKNAHNRKFCCDKCRIDNWEKTTGKKLNKLERMK